MIRRRPPQRSGMRASARIVVWTFVFVGVSGCRPHGTEDVRGAPPTPGPPPTPGVAPGVPDAAAVSPDPLSATIDPLLAIGNVWSAAVGGDFIPAMTAAADRSIKRASIADPDRAEPVVLLAARRWLGDADLRDSIYTSDGEADRLDASLASSLDAPKPDRSGREVAAASDAADPAEVRRALAALYRAVGRTDRAEAHLAVLAERRPRDTRLLFELAALRNAWGDRSGANALLRKIQTVAPLDRESLRGLMLPELSFVDVSTRPSVDDVVGLRSVGRLNAARALLAKGDVADAAAVLDAAPPSERSRIATRVLRGRVWLQNQDAAAMRRWFAGTSDRADYGASVGFAGSDPDDWSAEMWLVVGGWLQLEDRPAEAVECFRRCILMEPGSVDAHHRWSQSLTVMTGPSEEIAAATDGSAADGTAKTGRRLVDRLKLIEQSRTSMRAIYQSSPRSVGPLVGGLVRGLPMIGRPLEGLDWAIAARRVGVAGFDAAASRPRTDLTSAAAVRSARRGRLLGGDLPDLSGALGSIAASAGDASSGAAEPVPPRPPSASTTLDWDEAALELGVDFTYVNKPEPRTDRIKIHQSLGGGVAVSDYDRDGRWDLYFAQGGPGDVDQVRAARSGASIGENAAGAASSAASPSDRYPSDRFYRNVDGRFRDATVDAGVEEFGYGVGVGRGDWNQDGWPDIVVSNLGMNRMWVNQGDGTFRRDGVESDPSWDNDLLTSQCVIADLDGDGLPDLYQCNYTDDAAIHEDLRPGADGRFRAPGPASFHAAADHLWMRRPDGSCAVTRPESESQRSRDTGLGVVVGDLDFDGSTEIFVANDMAPNRFWEFDRTPAGAVVPTVNDTAAMIGLAVGAGGRPQACMGVAVGQFGGDERPDLHVTNFTNQWSNLFIRDGGRYRDRVGSTPLASLTAPMTGFGTIAFDIQGDGYDDLFIGNGHVYDERHRGIEFEMPDQWFVGGPAGLSAARVRDADGRSMRSNLTRGVAVVDLDGDSAVDLITTDMIDRAEIFLNRTAGPNSSVLLELIGRRSERSGGTGRLSVVDAGPPPRTYVQTFGHGYLGCGEPGIRVPGAVLRTAKKTAAESGEFALIDVTWPDETTERFAIDPEIPHQLLIESTKARTDVEPGIRRAVGIVWSLPPKATD